MYAERNRQIKKLLEKSFGRGNIKVRGHRGTATGWVDVRINYAPTDIEHRREIERVIWKMFARENIQIGTYGYDDPGSDYGYGREISFHFKQCQDVFNDGEVITTCNGKTGTIKNRDYSAGGDWYTIELTDGTTDNFYKKDLARVAA